MAWKQSARLRVLPAYTRDELPGLLATHDAGLFTSHVEGWGLSLSEMLESGMPVYATEAGAVQDIKPFFPSSLRPFPPGRSQSGQTYHLENLAHNGYLATFSWDAIAERYERDILSGSSLSSAGPRPQP